MEEGPEAEEPGNAEAENHSGRNHPGEVHEEIHAGSRGPRLRDEEEQGRYGQGTRPHLPEVHGPPTAFAWQVPVQSSLQEKGLRHGGERVGGGEPGGTEGDHERETEDEIGEEGPAGHAHGTVGIAAGLQGPREEGGLREERKAEGEEGEHGGGPFGVRGVEESPGEEHPQDGVAEEGQPEEGRYGDGCHEGRALPEGLPELGLLPGPGVPGELGKEYGGRGDGEEPEGELDEPGREVEEGDGILPNHEGEGAGDKDVQLQDRGPGKGGKKEPPHLVHRRVGRGVQAGSPAEGAQLEGGQGELEESAGENSPGEQESLLPGRIRPPVNRPEEDRDHGEVEKDRVEGGQEETPENLQGGREDGRQADGEDIGEEDETEGGRLPEASGRPQVEEEGKTGGEEAGRPEQDEQGDRPAEDPVEEGEGSLPGPGFLLGGEEGYEGRGEGTLAEEPAEEIGQGEGEEKGRGGRAQAKSGVEENIPEEPEEPRSQRGNRHRGHRPEIFSHDERGGIPACSMLPGKRASLLFTARTPLPSPAMSLIPALSEKLRRHPKRIVFPEGEDPRIMQAARLFASRELGVPVLLGERTRMKRIAQSLGISLDGIRLVEPERSEDFARKEEQLRALPRFAGDSPEGIRAQVADRNVFATLMLAGADVDAVLAGATSSASSALRPLLRIIPRQEGVSTVSSMQILSFDEEDHRPDLFLADCAVVPEPSARQLAEIALTAGSLRWHLVDERPRVALLSYTTHDEGCRQPSVLRVREATALAREWILAQGGGMEVDGDLQVDAALDPAVARAKEVDGPVGGSANVLIFPDLHSGNIASKMIQVLGGAHCYGHLLCGLTRPAAEISRGSSALEIFGTAVLVAAAALERSLLYPGLLEKAG